MEPAREKKLSEEWMEENNTKDCSASSKSLFHPGRLQHSRRSETIHKQLKLENLDKFFNFEVVAPDALQLLFKCGIGLCSEEYLMVEQYRPHLVENFQ